MESSTDTHFGYARDTSGAGLEDYESPEDYVDQGDIRVIKTLMFPYMVIAPNPSVIGQEILVEKVASRGDIVSVDQIGLHYLAKGERPDVQAFYTTAELESLQGAATPQNPTGEAPAGGDGIPGNFNELSAQEMSVIIEEQKPTTNELLSAVGNDKDAAQRLLDAENIATDNDPRAGVRKGVERIVGS
jgi:hypothetical protein